MARTAFIVLTYNRPDALLAVLRALALQCSPDHEVLIADDGSREDAVRAMRAGLPPFACHVRHVWHPDVGFTASRSRNLGAVHAQADYLVFLDGDCVPNPRFVSQHDRLRRAGRFVNGSRVLLSDRMSRAVIEGRVDLRAAGFSDWLRWRLRGDANKLTHLMGWAGSPGRVESAFRWKGIRSCNFGVWRRDFEAVNGFDETFSGWGHEDADLVLRLHHHGLMRKNAAWGTEVFHLAHPQASRAREGENRDRVLQRMQGRQVRADVGYAQAQGATENTVVTELN